MRSCFFVFYFCVIILSIKPVCADHVTDHEHLVSEKWVNQSKAQLIEKLGPPLMELDFRNDPTGPYYIIVYPKSRVTHKLECINAFVIRKTTGKVVSYYCR